MKTKRNINSYPTFFLVNITTLLTNWSRLLYLPRVPTAALLRADCSSGETSRELLCSINNWWEKTGVRSGNIHVWQRIREDTVIWFTSCTQPQHCVSLSMCSERSNVLTHFFLCVLLTFPLAMQTATNSELPTRQKEGEGGRKIE